MKNNQKFLLKFGVSTIEVTVQSDIPLAYIPELYDEVLCYVDDGEWQGEFEDEQKKVICHQTKKYITAHIKGSWKVLPEAIRISNWKKNSQLTVEDFEKIFPNQGLIYFELWKDIYNKSESDMIEYLGINSQESYLFMRMLIENVEQYEDNSMLSYSPPIEIVMPFSWKNSGADPDTK